MNRRSFLAVAGSGSLAIVAGCLDDIGIGGTNSDGDENTDRDESGYETQTFVGKEVPLVPVDEAYEWYENEEARFVDTRGMGQYDAGHIPGAVYSPAVGGDGTDPTDEWAHDTRIVTYCGCPHTLAGQRAAELKSEGFENVYAIDEGYGGWEDAEYPTERNDQNADVETHAIEGEADASNAGEYVDISTLEGSNYEVATIQPDGTYETEIRFPDVTAETELIVEAPDYTVEGTLEEFTSEPVTADS
ncbi:rhodanese-like domain-containing protein [Halostagnicola kamekurae]|uniref:Rhodanese-related sulfurtransferase n=1 Tax=Halostagnicola kamekurae TaxID=619731 RepID=A0A1I6P6L7_9EURY|nr:rhodanese-like domain-containing protein [Halostagnicola kamekurae]SFS35833.1 Rhodanese-related sulfurtransferase [Halostagnicola kamekurae]